MKRDRSTLEKLLVLYRDDGDESAIEELVQRTRPKLLAAARRSAGRPGRASTSRTGNPAGW